jgi:MbtH protein
VATNPFEDENGVYHVLINDEGQHSLWPTFVPVPDGWTIIHKAESRAACLELIEKNWTDMRPNSLIKAMNEIAENEPQEYQRSLAAKPESPTTPDPKRMH